MITGQHPVSPLTSDEQVKDPKTGKGMLQFGTEASEAQEEAVRGAVFAQWVQVPTNSQIASSVVPYL